MSFYHDNNWTKDTEFQWFQLHLVGRITLIVPSEKLAQPLGVSETPTAESLRKKTRNSERDVMNNPVAKAGELSAFGTDCIQNVPSCVLRVCNACLTISQQSDQHHTPPCTSSSLNQNSQSK
jgi:hypothetical protein